MLQFTNILIVRETPAQVFQFLANFENMPCWNYFVLRVSKMGQEPIQKGTTFYQERQTDSQYYMITDYLLNEIVAIETQPPTRYLRMEFRLEPCAEGTRISDTWSVQLGIFGFLSPLIRPRIQQAVRENLVKLGVLLDTGQVTLQNGRQSTWHDVATEHR